MLSFLLTHEVIPTHVLMGFISKLPSRMPELEVVYVELRPTLRRDQQRLLAESGMRRMEVGIESLSSSGPEDETQRHYCAPKGVGSS